MSQPTTYQGRLLFGDEADAVAYWKDKEWKKWAVDVTAGPPKRPTYRNTVYVRAKTAQDAVDCAKRNMIAKPPRGARFIARLAGPRELGCVPTPEKANHPPARSA